MTTAPAPTSGTRARSALGRLGAVFVAGNGTALALRASGEDGTSAVLLLAALAAAAVVAAATPLAGRLTTGGAAASSTLLLVAGTAVVAVAPVLRPR